MRTILLLIFTIGQTTAILSQQRMQVDSLFSFQLFTGIDYYHTSLEGEELDPLGRPTIGIGLIKKTKKNLTYSVGLQYFRRAARFTPSINLEERGIEFLIGPRYQLGDFSFFLNGIFSSASSKSYYSRVESQWGVPNEEVPNSNLRFQLGAEIKLMPKTSAFFSKTFVFDDQNSHINQIGIRYTFGPRRKTSERRVRRNHASNQIKDLREGALLVRLKNPSTRLNVLREKGLTKKADKIEARIEAQNRMIVNAFASKYTFSKVYFFYSQHSNLVRKGQFEGILYDREFKQIQDPTELEELKIFTAQFGQVSQDSTKHFDYTAHTVGKTPFSNQLRDYHYGGLQNSFDAIVISDQKFNQLSRPFPYYSRWGWPTYQDTPEEVLFYGPLINLLEEYLDRSVSRLNSRLIMFYSEQAED